MTDEKWNRPKFSDRIFRLALAVLPADFRSNYGGEMQRVFHEQQREAGEKEGFGGLMKLWWETLTGLLKIGPHEHWEMLKQDMAYALRMMRKNYGFTLVAVLTLGLGIGANTAIFSVVNAVLLSPLPYPKGGELVILRQQAQKQGLDDISFSVKEVQDYRNQNETFSGVAEYHSMTFTLLGGEEPLRVQTGVVSANFFDMFGIRPIQGRTFRDDDDKLGAPAVLLVSYEFWKNSLHGDPNIVGKTFRMNDKTHTVIGVLPPVPQYPNENDVYMPTVACPFRGSPNMLEHRDHRMMSVFARMKDGVKLSSSGADVATIAGRLAQEYPGFYPAAMGYRTISIPLKGELIKGAQPTLLILLGATGFVLLIACANVANLTLARMTQRERELAVRSALGAGRSRLLRQLLTESVMIAMIGALLGLAFASGGMDLLQGFAARFTPRAREIRIDYVVLIFTFIVAAGTSIVFGSLAAFISRESLAAGLKEGTGGASASRRRHRVRSVLIVTQIALSFLLLAGAGLMLRSFVKMQRVDPGFVPQHILSVGVNPDFTKYTKPEQYRELGEPRSRKHEDAAGSNVRGALFEFSVRSGFGSFRNEHQFLRHRGTPAERRRNAADGCSASGKPGLFQAAGNSADRGTHDHGSRHIGSAAGGGDQPGARAAQVAGRRSGRTSHFVRHGKDLVEDHRDCGRHEGTGARSSHGGSSVSVARTVSAVGEPVGADERRSDERGARCAAERVRRRSGHGADEHDFAGGGAERDVGIAAVDD